MTRIKTRHDVLIFRAFDKEVFRNGELEGPSLLLRHLRREEIDWKAVEDKHTPKTLCQGPCMMVRFKHEFHDKQWKDKATAHCKECIARLRESGKTHQCVKCNVWLARTDFKQKDNMAGHVRHLICDKCLTKEESMRQCIQCGQKRKHDEFPSNRWNRALRERVCLSCMEGKKCSTCPTKGGIAKFTKEEWLKADGVRLCKECIPKRCFKCGKLKLKSNFTKVQWRLSEGTAVCNDCDRRRCGQCGKEKTYKDFEASMWELADGSPAYKCRECTRGRRTTGMWTCQNRRCREQKPISEYSIAISRYGKPLKGNHIRCDVCIRREEDEARETQHRSSQQVQKRKHSDLA